MKIKLDENMPATLADHLRQLGHDVHTVPEELLAGHSDPHIWAAAQHEQRFLITQDLDFSDIRQFVPGTHAGILLVRLRNPGRIALLQIVLQTFMNEQVSAWSGCVVIVTERKIRIHGRAPFL
jgi:predicted nuclease of predicted toxin-antitoxin system